MALRHSQTVQVVQAALSDRTGTGTLRLDALPELNALADTNTPAGTRESVSLITLDHYLADWPQKRISFIKLDAEGHEAAVIAGARKIIRRDEPLVLFEVNLDGKFDLSLLKALESFGYTAFRLLPRLNVLVPFEHGEPLDYFQLNLFAGSAGQANELERRGLLVREPTREPPPIAPGFPGSGAISGEWSVRPDAGSSYAACLAYFGHAASTPNVADQIIHLVKALQLANAACGENPSLVRALTFAKLTDLLGLREHTVATLKKIAGELMRPEPPRFTEPFLRPTSVPGSRLPADQAQRSIVIEALEMFERTRHFSSFYLGETALPLLDHLCAQPHCSTEMHRRRLLVRRRQGLPLAPESFPILLKDTADNLNAGVWNSFR